MRLFYVIFVLAMTILQSTATDELATISSAVISNGDAAGYNHRYNEIVQPSLLDSIQRDLPKEAKFFDEIDRKFMLKNIHKINNMPAKEMLSIINFK